MRRRSSDKRAERRGMEETAFQRRVALEVWV
jgi:hypothetical protein